MGLNHSLQEPWVGLKSAAKLRVQKINEERVFVGHLLSNEARFADTTGSEEKKGILF
jgi:hypothetical protein